MVCNQLRECIDEFSKTPQGPDTNCSFECSKGRTTDSNPKFEEKKKVIVFQNPKRREVICYCVDGGMINDPTIVKCDGLFIVLGLNKAVFIELKGVDVKHAIEQISNTARMYKKDLQDFGLNGRIICSSATPRLQNEPYYLKLDKYFRENGGRLLIRENKHKENIEAL
ncbi:MAG: hypothetical protein ACYDEJ_02705 [Desulfitobacteriaceae bacterium]